MDMSSCVSSKVASPTDQWAATIFQWPECLGCRDDGARLVKVTEIFRFLRFFNLEKVSVMPLAAVDAHKALTEKRILGRPFLHLRNHHPPVAVALERLNVLAIV